MSISNLQGLRTRIADGQLSNEEQTEAIKVLLDAIEAQERAIRALLARVGTVENQVD